jgi:hypothetical protein
VSGALKVKWLTITSWLQACALARTETLCLIWPRMPCQPYLQPLPAVPKHTISRCNCRAHPPTATLQTIRTGSTIYKTHRLSRVNEARAQDLWVSCWLHTSLKDTCATALLFCTFP